MMRKRNRRWRRNGVGTTEWVLIAAAITLAVVATIATLGMRTSGDLSTTANDIADPSQLVNRFSTP